MQTDTALIAYNKGGGMKHSMSTVLVTCAVMTSGCMTDPSFESVSSSQHAVSLKNRISLNRISLNRIALNSLDNTIHTTPEGREVLEYVVRCALAEGDILVATHEGVEYEFPGLLGLATEWEFRALNTSEEHMLSACLLAHVNAFNVSVPISLRSPGALGVSADELVDYPVYEATFFGDLFGEFDTYSCIGDNPDVAAAHSPDRAIRVCGDPTEDCEIVSLGRCRDVCATRTPKQGWQDCRAPDGTLFSETVSAYLHDANNDCNNQTCGVGETCNFNVRHGGHGILDCSDADSCRAACKQGSTCTLDGTGADEFKAVVKRHSLAEVNCHETNECRAVCKGGDSSCEIDCKDANECRRGVKCKHGAECLLDCTGAVDCGFQVCHGTLQTCPGDIVVCNRPCP